MVLTPEGCTRHTFQPLLPPGTLQQPPLRLTLQISRDPVMLLSLGCSKCLPREIRHAARNPNAAQQSERDLYNAQARRDARTTQKDTRLQGERVAGETPRCPQADRKDPLAGLGTEDACADAQWPQLANLTATGAERPARSSHQAFGVASRQKGFLPRLNHSSLPSFEIR